MNIFLNECFGFWFELNFELNHFSARFNEKMNSQNVSPTPRMVMRKHMMIFLKNGCKLFDSTLGAMWTGFEPEMEGVFNETYVEILQVCSS